MTSIQPTITLDKPHIPKHAFQEIINHLITKDYKFIDSVYFENMKFTYRLISFNVFGHIRSALKKELKKPIIFSNLKNNTDNYDWLKDEYFPKFPDDIDQTLNYLEKKPHKLIKGYKKSKIKNIEYVLDDSYDVKYNYVFDIHPTDLVPVFEIYIKTKIKSIYTNPNFPIHVYDPKLFVENHLKYILLKFNVELIFI